MPKKKKAGKNSKNKKGYTQETRALIEPDMDGQVFGILEKALGNRFFDVNCLDGKTRRCKVRNRRLKVEVGNVTIVSLRDFDDKNADVIYKYLPDEVRELRRLQLLPSLDSFGGEGNNGLDSEEDECAFDFDAI